MQIVSEDVTRVSFGEETVHDTIEAAVKQAQVLFETAHKVGATLLITGSEGLPPEYPCESSDQVRRFAEHWRFRDGIDRLKVWPINVEKIG